MVALEGTDDMSNQMDIAEFVIAKEIVDKPEFISWIPNTLKKKI